MRYAFVTTVIRLRPFDNLQRTVDMFSFSAVVERSSTVERSFRTKPRKAFRSSAIIKISYYIKDATTSWRSQRMTSLAKATHLSLRYLQIVSNSYRKSIIYVFILFVLRVRFYYK